MTVKQDIFKQLTRYGKNRLIFYIVLMSLLFTSVLLIFVTTLTQSISQSEQAWLGYLLVPIFWLYAAVVIYFIIKLEQITLSLVQSDSTVATLNIRDVAKAKKIHGELLERELMLNQAQSVAKVGCWKWEMDSDKVQLSEEAKRIYDIDLKEEYFTNEVLSARIPSNEREMVANAINETIFFKKDYHVQHHIHASDGKLKVVEQFGQLYMDEHEKVKSMLGVVKDITEQTESGYALKLGRNVFNYSAEAILVCDPDGRILQVNPAFENMCGFVEAQLLGQTTSCVISTNHNHGDTDEQIKQALDQEGLWHGELWCKHQNGQIYLTDQTISAVKDHNGLIVQCIYLLRDITESKRQQDYIQNLAHFDQLTSLPNRALFMDRLHQAINRARRSDSLFALLFIDLDRFKYVNDTLGHDAGDELLMAVSSRLRECIREQDTAARLGGDEFTIILEELSEPQDSLLVTEKIIERISDPFSIRGEKVVVGATIGISLFPEHGDNEDILIKCADTAMYQAKAAGRNQGKMYHESMLSTESEAFQQEIALRRAIDEDQLELFFQPQINITCSKVTGCEALVRWNHPERGQVGPVEFVPLAEQTGLIVPLGKWVLRKALELYGNWQSPCLKEITISVNVSSKQLCCAEFLEVVKNALHDYQVCPQRLELEITESAVMDNPSYVIQLLNSIRELGVNISLDDFGTGYSSLSYLKKLPVTKVKIDRSFVRDINIDHEDEAIVKAIIAMTNSLGLKVIAEGAESQDHIDFIRLTDCEDVQGYYYSRPLAEQEFVDFVSRFNHSPLAD